MESDIRMEELVEDRRSTSPEDEEYEEANNEKRWRLSHLKNQFEHLELHKLFNGYLQRISHGYFSQFLSLQIILITTHFIILLVAVEDLHAILPDLILYGLASLLSIILLVITDIYVKTRPQLLKVLAATAFVTIFFINAFIPFYCKENLRPAYSTYLIISNYIFLNISNDLVAMVLGLSISIFHLVTLILVTYDNTDKILQRLGSDIIYLVCVNGMGMYFRYMNEIVIRRSFLDRRSCIEYTHWLKFEEEQENHLMSSIIPQHIIVKDRETLLQYILHTDKSDSISNAEKFEQFHIEEHPNVTILFADIVNYTAMTTKLNITDLLDVLNELFSRFDDASEELGVLRVKFLGDCYYCVAGLPPNPTPNHADACVELGLKMILIIADIRHRKNLDINMRIGIHSGKISSGIIGILKRQYDIWSNDVDTANKMETEGEPGMVHITDETKQLLKRSYNIISSKKFVNRNVTYLITPSSVKTELSRDEIEYNKTAFDRSNSEKSITRINSEKLQPRLSLQPPKLSLFKKRINTAPGDLESGISQNVRSYSLIGNYRETQDNYDINIGIDGINGKRHTFPTSNAKGHSVNPTLRPLEGTVDSIIPTENDLTVSDRKRITAFMNNNIKRRKEILEDTNRELETTIEKMLLSKFEQWFKLTDMYRIILAFKDLKSELDFLKMPDPLFKYYLLAEVLLLIFVFILENLSLARWDWAAWPYYVTIGIIIFILVPLSWTHYLWSKYIAKHGSDHPSNIIIKFLYKASKSITNNVYIRLGIYTGACLFFLVCVLFEWLDCYNGAKSPGASKRNFLFLVLGGDKNEVETECIIPWHMTETFALAILMSFLFLRMPMWLKLLYASIIAAVYSYCIFEYSSGDFYGDRQTYNHLLSPKISHVMSVVFLTLILHLVDRQTEYMNRIDHVWYKKLVEKEKQVNTVHQVNNVLLMNILPIDVAHNYLNLNRLTSEEVYHENYPDAAVMFASLTNFSVEEFGSGFLKKMSELISEFDMLLIEDDFGRHIEKIKIAKWTYMAACGLAPGLSNSENIGRDDPRSHVVISLLKFAACLMKTLKKINGEFQQMMKLRIGICHGSIAAGVVGSKKPLYDIWGDPVNMASRMDTTGRPDHIQVLKPTAEIIMSFGYVCQYRGKIKVKGRENRVPTYFVALDEDFNLIQQPTDTIILDSGYEKENEG